MLKIINRLLVVLYFILTLLTGCKNQNSASNVAQLKPNTSTVDKTTRSDSTSAQPDTTTPIYIHDIEGYKASELGRAIYQDSLSKFKSLVERGASIEDCLTDETYTYDALYTAIEFGRLDFIQFIVQNNYYSDINKTYSEDAETALTLACNRQDKNQALQIALILIVKGAKVDGTGPSGGEETKYPLIIAAKRNNVELVKALVEKGVNKAVTENSGATAASIATDSGFSEITELLKSIHPG